jgi:hypothetical protein|tara:strand:+ start:2618 stop:3487 length:870 start_codon:yes stop_codon:yes gene_type:complete
MARNIYFSDAVRSEQRLYENIIIESLKMYGQDLYYLPRTIVNENQILGEDVPSQFSNSYKIEMYIENTEGFDGEGDLFTKFGVEIRDEATFVVSRKRWNHTVGQANNEISGERPREGDILYLPMTNSMFEVMHVEHESPFYQLANLPTFKMRCQLFEYSGEDLDTGVAEIDGIEVDHNYTFELTVSNAVGDFRVGEMAHQVLSSGVTIKGEVSGWTSSENKLSLIHLGADDGKFHLPVPSIEIRGVDTNATAMVDASTEVNDLHENEQNDYFGGDFLDFSEGNPFGDPS